MAVERELRREREGSETWKAVQGSVGRMRLWLQRLPGPGREAGGGGEQAGRTRWMEAWAKGQRLRLRTRRRLPWPIHPFPSQASQQAWLKQRLWASCGSMLPFPSSGGIALTPLVPAPAGPCSLLSSNCVQITCSQPFENHSHFTD